MILQPVSSGGGGGSAQIIVADCIATDTVGKAVRITGDAVAGIYQVTTVDIDKFDTPQEAIGFGVIRHKETPTATRCVVQTGGVMSGILSGLTPGARLFVGESGELVPSPPPRDAVYRVIQRAAYVLSSTDVLIDFEEPTGVTAA